MNSQMVAPGTSGGREGGRREEVWVGLSVRVTPLARVGRAGGREGGRVG